MELGVDSLTIEMVNIMLIVVVILPVCMTVIHCSLLVQIHIILYVVLEATLPIFG